MNISNKLQYGSSSILESWVRIFGQMTPTLRLPSSFLSAIYIWLEDQWRWSVIWHFQTHYNILYVKSVTRLMVWQESILLDLIHFSLIGKMQNSSYIFKLFELSVCVALWTCLPIQYFRYFFYTLEIKIKKNAYCYSQMYKNISELPTSKM